MGTETPHADWEPGAIDWLRETDKLSLEAIKRATWEDLRATRVAPHTVRITNHSWDEPDQHAHEVDHTDEIVCSCTCGQYTYRDTICKHMVRTAVLLDRGLLSARPNEADEVPL